MLAITSIVAPCLEVINLTFFTYQAALWIILLSKYSSLAVLAALMEPKSCTTLCLCSAVFCSFLTFFRACTGF